MSHMWNDPTSAAVTIYAVDGSAGVMALDNTDTDGTQVLLDLDVAECEITFAMDWTSGGAGSLTPSVYYRAAEDLSTFFKIDFSVDLDPLTSDEITAITLRSETGVLDTASVSKVHTVGVPFRVKVRSTQNHYIKVWSSNVAEPAGWDMVAGSGSTNSGTVGLAGLAQLDSPIPDPLENVAWMWGGETAVSAYTGPPVQADNAVLGTTSNMSIGALGTGFDGVGRAIIITATNGTAFVISNSAVGTAASKTVTGYFHIKFVGSLPTSATDLVYLFGFEYNALATFAGVSFRASDSRLVLQPNTSTSTGVVAGPVVVADTWYEVQVYSNSTGAATFVYEWSVDGVAQTQATRGVVASQPVIQVHVGPRVNNCTMLGHYDDVVVQTSAAQYPIDESISLVRVMPSATITEAGTANVFCRFTSNGSGLDVTFNAANILAAISEYPPSQAIGTGSDGFYQRITGTASDVINVPYADYSFTAGQGPGAVRLYSATWTSTLGVAGGRFTVTANVGGSSTSVWDGFSATTATQWFAGIYTPSGGWDAAKFNALVISFTATNDVSPLPGARFIMAELAVLTSGDAGATAVNLEFDDLEVCALEVSD